MTNNTIFNVPVATIKFNHYQVDGTISRETVEEIKSSLIQNKDNGSKGLLQITRGRQMADGTYEQAFGRFPEVCLVSEKGTKDIDLAAVSKSATLTVKASRAVQPNYLWIGYEEALSVAGAQ